MKPFFSTAEALAHFLSTSLQVFFFVVAVIAFITNNFDRETALRNQAISIFISSFPGGGRACSRWFREAKSGKSMVQLLCITSQGCQALGTS